MIEYAPLPIGWIDLITDMHLAIAKDFPGVSVREITSDRGWLYVRVDDSSLVPADQVRLNRLVQGFVTQSLHLCMCCGSVSGRERAERREIACDGCEEEHYCDADE